MSRDLDPRFSTALRDELTRRADVLDADPAAEPTLPARRQWIVVAVTAAVLLVLIGGLLTAYHRPVPPANGSIPSTAPSTLVEGLADPLTELEDASVGSKPYVLLHVAGTGPSSYRITVPSGATAVSAYLSCTTGSFRMDVGGKAFWSECSRQTVTARIPVGTGERTVRITVDAGTRFIALALPWAEGTTFSQLTVTQTPLPYPTSNASRKQPVLVRVRGDSATARGSITAGARSVEADIVCRGAGGLVVHVGAASFGSKADGDWKECRDGSPLFAAFGKGTTGTLPAGRPLAWSVQPYGDVTWAVVIVETG